MEAEKVFKINITLLYIAVFFFGTRFLCKVIFNNNFSNFKFKNIWANNITIVLFFLTKKWKKLLMLINFQNYTFANKDLICGVPLLTQIIPIVSKAKNRKACVNNI